MSQSPSSNVTLYSIDPKTYLDKSERNIQRVSNRLDDYIKDPNEENIHNIRTAIRRLLASVQSLPKKLRKKKKVKEYVMKSKELFSVNSKIRDCDIIFEKLSRDTHVETHAELQQEQLRDSQTIMDFVYKSLKIQRQKRLSAAKDIALELRRLSVPKLHRIKISKRNLEKRFNEVVSNLANRIKNNYPIVMHSAERITELHEMRKDCKKLRYMLELLPVEENIKNKNKNRSKNNDKISQLIKDFEVVQDMLGTIHDYDTTIAYLKNHQKHGNSIQVIIEHLCEDRRSKYEKFVQYCKTDLSVSKNLFVNIWNIA